MESVRVRGRALRRRQGRESSEEMSRESEAGQQLVALGLILAWRAAMWLAVPERIPKSRKHRVTLAQTVVAVSQMLSQPPTPTMRIQCVIVLLLDGGVTGCAGSVEQERLRPGEWWKSCAALSLAGY